MPAFRIVTNSVDPEEIIEVAATPLQAVRNALSADLMRSGNARNLACKVYWQDDSGSLNLVKFYHRIGGGKGLSASQAREQMPQMP